MSREFSSLLNLLSREIRSVEIIDSNGVRLSSCPLGTGDAELAKSVVNRRLMKETCMAASAITRLDLKARALVDIDKVPAVSERISSSARGCNDLITIELNYSRLRSLPEKGEGLNCSVHEVIVDRAGKGGHFGETIV